VLFLIKARHHIGFLLLLESYLVEGSFCTILISDMCSCRIVGVIFLYLKRGRYVQLKVEEILIYQYLYLSWSCKSQKF
jgi:hypothetical protein